MAGTEKIGSLRLTWSPRSGRYGGDRCHTGLIHRAPPLPDPGRGSEDLQLHLHHHLRLGVSFQTRGLWLPSVLPGQVTERGRGQVIEDWGGGEVREDLEPEDLS